MKRKFDFDHEHWVDRGHWPIPDKLPLPPPPPPPRVNLLEEEILRRLENVEKTLAAMEARLQDLEIMVSAIY